MPEKNRSKNIGMNLYCVSKKFCFLIMSDCFCLDMNQILYIFSELINRLHLSSEKKEAYEILVQLINGTMSFESSASKLRQTISAPDTSAPRSITPGRIQSASNNSGWILSKIAGILTNGFRPSDPTRSAQNSTESCQILSDFAGFRRYPNRNPVARIA